MSATKPTKAELEAIAKRFADPAFRDAYNTLRVARASDFLADPDKWLAHAKGGPVSVVDEKGRHVCTLSVPREEKPSREAALEAALSAVLETVPTCGHDDCHRDAFTSVRVDGRTPSNPGGWYRAWFCDEHIPAHVSEYTSLARMRAAVEKVRAAKLLADARALGGG